jgi:negative regulator of sigma E activity
MMRRMGRPGLVGTMARTAVVAGTATAVAGGVRNRQEQKQAAQQAEAAPAAPPPPAPAPAAAPSSEVDITGELTKLAEMRNNGILTDEEFAQAKAKLLG